jgi:hypothetical protein
VARGIDRRIEGAIEGALTGEMRWNNEGDEYAQ